MATAGGEQATATQPPAASDVSGNQAANAPASEPSSGANAAVVQEVIVTGTSLRGVAPVGSDLISVNRANIESTNSQTVQQVLKAVPAVTGLNSSGQGSFGSADASGVDAPTIHGLGGSASNSTLVLVDGHRLPLSGINHTLADPNIVPVAAIQRVEVLPDGASSTYGSDAVAGVINFITVRKYDGLELSGQTGFGDDYSTYNANLLGGAHWDRGSFVLAYSYSDRSSLSAASRPFTQANHTSQGGSNLASFACAPASVQPAGSSNIYAYPYNGAGIANAQSNAFCDYSGIADILPKEQRNNVMLRVQENLTDKLSVDADVFYDSRIDRQQIQRGTVTATVDCAGNASVAQVNPFCVRPTNSTATSETVRFDADSLLGPGANNHSSDQTFMVDPELIYRIDDNFTFTLGGTFGADDSRLQTLGQLCVSCAYLGLNGTTNGAGNLTTPSVAGSTNIILNTPLTAANSLDVWTAGADNRTSAAVLKQLTDSTSTSAAHQTIVDLRPKIDGTVFNLPAGPVKAAIGGEYTHYTLRQDLTRPENIGPASLYSSFLNINYDRSVSSAYVEALFPLISDAMGIPLVRSLDLDIAARYDDYSDFGSTENPKFALNWEIFHGLKLRANYAQSFVAPALTSIGAGNGLTGESGYLTYGLGVINVPTAAYPAAATLPGCAGKAVCQLGTSTLTGVELAGGNAGLTAQHGETWSVGVDYTPDWLKGFRGSVTFWSNRLAGGVTAPVASLAINTASLHNLLTIYPGGATPAQIAAAVGTLPLTGALPATTYFTYDYRQQNVLNLYIEGVDADISYGFSTPVGHFTVGGALTEETEFNQQIGSGERFSVLNTTGFNTTFPSIQTQFRGDVGWSWRSVSADVFVNYTGSYRNYSSTTVTPLVRDAAGYPVSGGDKVNAYTTVDLHVAYDLPKIWPFSYTASTQVYADVQNIGDTAPPFYNNFTSGGASGYDTFNGNPIGRLTSVGLRAKFR